MDQFRPGALELFKKVKAAQAAVSAGLILVAVADHLSNDLAELEIDSAEELWALLPRLLQELEAFGPGACYRGRRPDPDLSCEETVKGLKLWAFVWNSAVLGCEVYLKFCLKERTTGGAYYAHLRIHKNR